MPNFPGAITYPVLTGRSPMMDTTVVTKGREVSIPRGGTAADFNVRLRGSGKRVDKRPLRPYP